METNKFEMCEFTYLRTASILYFWFYLTSSDHKHYGNPSKYNIATSVQKSLVINDSVFESATLKGICTLSRKNDVILSVQKRYCTLGLGLELVLGVSGNTFSVKRVFEQV